MPSLKNGRYHIFINPSEGQMPAQNVGRRLAEDRSLFPKGVVVRPRGTEPEAWTFERASGDRFILMVRGAPTANFDNKVFAILLSNPPPTYWTILPADGKDLDSDIYTIALSSDLTKGWAASSDNEHTDQISIKPLNGNPAELFIIKSVNE